ncbi:MAG: VOC family protein [Candidatus Doudnabacteria bacterium]|nr:VOC family protein [Candidatus Doudnabacteria bacterium]
MQKIIPHLWYDKEAKEAAEFYVSVFPTLSPELESKITSSQTLKNTPSGDCDIMAFKIWGYNFISISAGPYFKLNPSVSFMVNFDPSQDPSAKTRIDGVWQKLSEGGQALMPLDKYPFSERYGWIQDKFGLSWQLILTNPQGEERPLIMPSLLFTKPVNGKTKEATDFYISVFTNSPYAKENQNMRGALALYTKDTPHEPEGSVMFTDFKLNNQWFVAMDSSLEHKFNFNEAVSLLIQCEDQKEIDYFWEKLSFVPDAEQCGWLKDKFGISWQVAPKRMSEMMQTGTPEQIARVTQSFLKMKKFQLDELEKAFQG